MQINILKVLIMALLFETSMAAFLVFTLKR